MMDQLPRYAIISDLITHLIENKSWCGETHIQKATFFLQDLLGVPIGFDFILYKHGPFSFDLRDELAVMRAYGLLELVPQSSYGPKWFPTTRSEKLEKNYTITLDKYHAQIEFVAAKLGNKRIGELEKLATALYVTQRFSGENSEQLAARIHELKPHVSIENAMAALQVFQAMALEAKQLPKVDIVN
jgi:hypothetical protein